MANNVLHFDIPADDLARARRFYERVFGWHIRPWGPPDFFMIRTGEDPDPGIHGSLSRRPADERAPGRNGFVCTISVSDLAATEKAIVENGGAIQGHHAEIPGVGRLFYFDDTEGNTVGCMQYVDGFDHAQTGA
jgi:predicted enzyme related to lactoylglutathione lyase